eukprot:9710377-Lingulodinium_polyedra.AAC.1
MRISAKAKASHHRLKRAAAKRRRQQLLGQQRPGSRQRAAKRALRVEPNLAKSSAPAPEDPPDPGA